jgi:hypothetical protein
VTHNENGKITEFIIGNETVSELWVRHIDYDSSPRTITIYDKYELKNVPEGYFYVQQCSQEYYENLSMNAVVKYKNEYGEYRKKLNTQEPMPSELLNSSDILMAWYFNETTFKYVELENIEGIRCAVAANIRLTSQSLPLINTDKTK